MTRYHVQYQLHDQPIGTAHRTIRAAVRHMRACQAAATRGGDCQAIDTIVMEDGDIRAMTGAEYDEYRRVADRRP